MKNMWYKLPCKRNELQLLGTLNGGQSFRWKKILHEQKEQWLGVFYEKMWILQQEDDFILYKVHERKLNELGRSETYYNELLRNYFQLDVNIEKSYEKWSQADPYFKAAAKQFYGIRILKQDITENIFSFICSSNNHITRISSMVEKLAKYYGEEICVLDGEKYHAFPKLHSLAQESVEEKLRTNGFGYRAKYISKTAQHIVESGGEEWINKLKLMSYEDAKKELMSLMGIGAKVADCICLMSLNHLQAIPVDTHIYQIARRLFMPKLPDKKTVTEKIYNEIGDYFRNLYGPLAGWAHTVLFCADLKKFQGNKDDNDRDDNSRKKIKCKK